MHKGLGSDTVVRLMAGDQDAFELIYDLCSEKLFRLAYRFLKDTEQSEEVVQETFINLWVNREKLDPQGNIWLYLYVVGKRLALNQLRSASQSRLYTERLLVQFEETHNSTEEAVFLQELKVLTERVIDNLPKQQQVIYRLSRVEGFSHKEIADQLNISTNTVKNHMGAALRTIKSNLAEGGLVSLLLVSVVMRHIK
ncbi:RNA polymerase sigma-70 factor (ECF subfamily) [Mucilaginibacter yixingensis]|uniref:RNA polymerase sigma-70 factor (ECF subfamily) n=1 Tax=Mucilaginibacter yixingensis TaxID=1295612 RepID=A0A2T5JAG3_9SPHI|nr:RNA polymerase sigma-70 factor [Mucilaginibacter yixingensis]PTQ97862.1 RNA polymerase sigma-70 factor (ECF subfamily) [Mucilaginibacter yixingensis]